MINIMTCANKDDCVN